MNGKPQRYSSPHGVAHDMGFFDVKMIKQSSHVRFHFEPILFGIMGLATAAVAAAIEGDNFVVLPKHLNDVGPLHFNGTGKSVDQDDGFALFLSGDQVVNGDTVRIEGWLLQANVLRVDRAEGCGVESADDNRTAKNHVRQRVAGIVAAMAPLESGTSNYWRDDRNGKDFLLREQSLVTSAATTPVADEVTRHTLLIERESPDAGRSWQPTHQKSCDTGLALIALGTFVEQ